MNAPADPSPSSEETEQAELNRLLAEGLRPIAPAHGGQLRARLLERVSHSAAQHAALRTVRQKDGAWQAIKAGIRYKLLWAGPQGNSVLIEFAPGTGLPVHRHRWLEEGIVLRGGLQTGALDLGPLDYHVAPAGSRHDSIRSRQGALAYLRGTSLADTPSVWRELLGGLLPLGGDRARSVLAADAEPWEAIAEGVERKHLCSDGAFSSHYYRLQPGACMPGHGHPRDEECMMLQGELFLGDILLREGDYQLAPAGSRHGDIYTDVGATLFVRSARQD